MNRLRSKAGLAPTCFLIVAGIVGAISTLGLVKTAIDGTLVNNMKVIGCKVMNNGENYCNDKYDYTPKTESTVRTFGNGGNVGHN